MGVGTTLRRRQAFCDVLKECELLKRNILTGVLGPSLKRLSGTRGQSSTYTRRTMAAVAIVVSSFMVSHHVVAEQKDGETMQVEYLASDNTMRTGGIFHNPNNEHGGAATWVNNPNAGPLENAQDPEWYEYNPRTGRGTHTTWMKFRATDDTPREMKVVCHQKGTPVWPALIQCFFVNRKVDGSDKRPEETGISLLDSQRKPYRIELPLLRGNANQNFNIKLTVSH
jgi:hypothetical protein